MSHGMKKRSSVRWNNYIISDLYSELISKNGGDRIHKYSRNMQRFLLSDYYSRNKRRGCRAFPPRFTSDGNADRIRLLRTSAIGVELCLLLRHRVRQFGNPRCYKENHRRYTLFAQLSHRKQTEKENKNGGK